MVSILVVFFAFLFFAQSNFLTIKTFYLLKNIITLAKAMQISFWYKTYPFGNRGIWQDISSFFILALQGHYWKKGMRYSILVKIYSKKSRFCFY